ncbi:hypothetical protein D6D13_08798 [Aureobasidium pullulans]|uniref:Uncharacterized protein n=1 Tax=Aureobasidium pullulans TaxID=5580 RepID=A0A4S9C4U1_AURPU|nr:hypothetical protein D6D13_08798 [Aureobasidium pullulans]
MDRPLSDQGTVLEFVSTHGYMPSLDTPRGFFEVPIPLCSGASGPFDFSITVEHAPFDVPIKRGSPTLNATTVASGPTFVRKMDVRRSPVPWMRFVAIPVAQPSNPTGHDKPMENSPSPHHQDGEVTSAQHASNIEDEVEAEAGDSLIDEVIAALYRHVEALKEHTSVLEDLIVTLKQTRN